MKQRFQKFAVLSVALVSLGAAHAALAQKQGGTLRVYHRDSPASMSIQEEGTVGVMMPMMGVFNNLVLFDQHVPQNSLESIVPELATSWAWSEDGIEDARMTDTEHRDIGRLRQFGDARIALAARDRGIIGIDRKYRAGEADAVE